MTTPKKKKKAAERTMMSWGRTSLGVMVFAIAVSKFNTTESVVISSLLLALASLYAFLAILRLARFRYRLIHKSKVETANRLVSIVTISTTGILVSIVLFMLLRDLGVI